MDVFGHTLVHFAAANGRRVTIQKLLDAAVKIDPPKEKRPTVGGEGSKD